MDFDKKFIITPGQRAALIAGKKKMRFVLHGPVGGGKSLIQAMLVLWYMGTEKFLNSERMCLIAGYDSKALGRNVIEKFRFLLGGSDGENVSFHRTQNEAKILGQVFEVRAIDKPASKERIAGARWDILVLDEMTRLAEEPTRETLARTRGFFVGTTNPDSPSHFVKAEYIDNPENNPLIGSAFVTTESNPSFSAEYIKMMSKDYSGNSTMHSRMVAGEWVYAAGKVYSIVPGKNTYHDLPESFKGTRKIQAVIGVDWGSGSETAIVLALIKREESDMPLTYVTDNVVIKRDDEDSDTSGIKKAIAKLVCRNDIRPIFSGVYVDRTAHALINELRRDPFLKGFPVFESKSDVLSGIDFVGKMLLFGRLKIKRGLHILKEFDGYVWDEKACSVGKDKPIKEDDHSLDALRYALYTHAKSREAHRPGDRGVRAEKNISSYNDWQNFGTSY